VDGKAAVAKVGGNAVPDDILIVNNQYLLRFRRLCGCHIVPYLDISYIGIQTCSFPSILDPDFDFDGFPVSFFHVTNPPMDRPAAVG
jgi:hypothetical protein